MIIEQQVTIRGSKSAIWSVISNIENTAQVIGSIEKIELIDRPEDGLIGLKWRESRKLFGKTATEEMWVTEAAENELFESTAESNGCIYVSTKKISEQDGNCTLTMIHATKPQGLLAKLMAFPLGLVFKGMFKKLILQDLNDIKAAVEQPGDN